MKTKIARHISPAAIAIALFLAVALLTRGGTITAINTDNSGVDSLHRALVHLMERQTGAVIAGLAKIF